MEQSNKQSFRAILAPTLIEIAKKEPLVTVITADLVRAVKIGAFQKECPKQSVSVGISEADMISVAAGMATTGIIPVIVGFAMFTAVKPFEQIRNSVAYPNLNVKIIATHGGLCVGKDGGSHQAIEDIALMRSLPNFTVFVAADAYEAKAAIKEMVQCKGPVYLRLGRDEATNLFSLDKKCIIGGSDTLVSGNDVAIVACGLMVEVAMEAAEELASQGISARVINAYSLKPLDEKSIHDAAVQTGAIVTVEDHSVIGGLGSATASFLGQCCPVPIEMVGVNDTFGESGSQEELYQKYGLTKEHVVQAALKAVSRKKS